MGGFFKSGLYFFCVKFVEVDMEKLVKCEMKIIDKIAVVYLVNPPVNALSESIRNDIYELLTSCADNSEIRAVIFTTQGLPFSAGADIKEFSGPMKGKFFLDFYRAIKKLNKPVIMGIDQYALGGGLEFCMLAHHRIATPKSRLGLPEVKLGLIPGGTGTMSLPRLVGIEKALDMIISSNPVSAKEALEIGLIDAISSDDLEKSCLDFAKNILNDSNYQLSMPIERDNPKMPSMDYFKQKKTEFLKKYHGFKAPLRLLSCLEAAATLPLDKGLAFEMQQFMDLISGEDSQGMRYAFFSERLASVVPSLNPKEALDIKKVGVIGGGLMGSGIAMAFLNRGFTVMCVEVDPKRVEVCQKGIEKQFQKSVQQGKISQSDYDSRLKNFSVTQKIEDVQDVDLVIEAVFEKLDLKLDIMRQLDEICQPSTILASNTSGLDLNQIASVTKRPEKVVGLHFFSPAHIMRLLEVVRTEKTDSVTLQTALTCAKQLKKVSVVVGVCPGFVGNRMIFKYFEQVVWLLLRGCSPQQIDSAMKSFGFPMGPCEMADMSGLDIWVHANPDDHSLITDFVANGRLGQKSGSGFYDYSQGDKTPQESKEAAKIIADYAKKQQIESQECGQDVIVSRLLMALISEGMHILSEKVVQRASDIDTIYVHGYGFPIYRGGPMFYADQLGVDEVKKQLQTLVDQDPEAWKMSPILDECITSSKKLSAYKTE